MNAFVNCVFKDLSETMHEKDTSNIRSIRDYHMYDNKVLRVGGSVAPHSVGLVLLGLSMKFMHSLFKFLQKWEAHML